MTPKPPTMDEQHAARRERVWTLRRLDRVELRLDGSTVSEVTQQRLEEVEERLMAVEARVVAVEARAPVPRLP